MATLTIGSGKAFPSWTFSHYLFYTELNYRKLATIKRILDLLMDGHADDDFKVALSSVYIFQDREISEHDFERYISFHSKGDDYIEFWHFVRRLDRPAVFVRSERTAKYEPVFRPWGPEALKIRDARLQSPFNITLEGIAEAINALRFGKARELRAAELHEIAIRQAELGIEKESVAVAAAKLELLDKLQSMNLTDEAKQVIKHHVVGIVANQAEKNYSIDAQFQDISGGILPVDQENHLE